MSSASELLPTTKVAFDEVALRATLTAALHSLRATSVCRPRPTNADLQALREGMAAVHGGSTAPNAPELLELLAETRLQRLCPPSAAPAGPRAAYGALKDAIVDAYGEPDLVMYVAPPRLASFEAKAAGKQTHWAFHGSSFENVWSILNTGLINAAQMSPELAKTGSIFGKGIYLSVVPSYAANFAKTSPPLPHDLGRWSCLFLCQVAPGPMVTIGGASGNSVDGSDGASAQKDAHDVPEGVIVVEDSDAVVVRCALFYRRSSGGGGFCGSTAQMVFGLIVVLVAIASRTVSIGPGRRHWL